MRGVVAWVLGLMTVGVLLAGCAEPAPEQESDLLEGFGEDVEVGPSTGAIAGIVVDPAIRPLAGVLVEDLSRGVNTTSDADGRFVFQDLEPGTYFLKATAKRHEPAQSSVVVVAGEAATLRVMLLPSGGAEPYQTTLQYRGHIDMWLGFGQFAAEVVAPGTLQCACAWEFTVDPGLQTIVFEAFGSQTIENPGTPATDDGDAYWELINQGSGEIKSEYDEWPVVKRFDNGSFEEPSDTYLARITGGVPPSGTMDYDLFITLFYHEPAPEGWTILDQG